MHRFFLALLVLSACDCEKDEVAIDAPAGDRPTTNTPTLASPTTLTFAADEQARVVSIALAPDGTRVVATGWGKRVVALPLDGSASTELYRIGDGDLFQDGAIAWSGERLVIGTFSSLVVLATDGTLVAEVPGRTYSVAAHGEGFVRARGFEAVEIVSREGVVGTSVAIPDVRDVVSTTEAVYALTTVASNYVIVELDPTTLAERARIPAPTNAGLAAGGGRLVSIGNPGTVLRGTTVEGSLDRGDFPDDFSAFSLAGTWAAGLGFNRGVALFDLDCRVLLARADSDNGEDIVLDGDRRILVAGADGVYVFEIVRE
jgi:hypothetical protein